MTRSVTRSTIWAWVGPCASALCIVHCFGTALLALIAPGILELLPHSEIWEFVIFGVSAISTALTLKLYRPSLQTWMIGLAGLISGIAGLALHQHTFLIGGLLIFSSLSITLAVRKHFHSKTKPECCSNHPT
jgi:hypothetical protein